MLDEVIAGPAPAGTDTIASVLTRLAVLDIEGGQRQSAHQRLAQALDKDRTYLPARLVRARLLIFDGDRGSALDELKAVVKAEPKSPTAVSANILLGGIYADSSRKEDAIDAYREALAARPASLAANVALANLHLSMGETDQARIYARGAVESVPASPTAHATFARVALAAGRLTEAKASLARLQQAFPKSAPVVILSGYVHLAEGRLGPASAAFAEAIRLEPDNAEATSALVKLDLDLGNSNAALARVEAALKNKPSIVLMLLAGRTYLAVKDLDKAEASYKKVIETAPDQLDAYAMLGRIYVERGRLGDAEKQFKSIVDRNPRSVSGGTMLGMIYEAQRRIPEAEAQYKAVLTVDSKAAVAANNLAWIFVSSNRNLDEALTLARTAHAQASENPAISDTLGWVLVRRGESVAAIPYLEDVVRKRGDVSGHYHLGIAYFEAGDFRRAKASLKRALALSSSFPGAEEARQKLALIR